MVHERKPLRDPQFDLASLRIEVGPLDVPRTEKVVRLRAAIAGGSYRPDLHDVARKFLRETLEQLLA